MLFLYLAVSHFDTVTHKQISTEKAVEYVVDCRCDRSVRDTTSGVHILDHLHELRSDWNLRNFIEEERYTIGRYIPL